MQHVTLGSQGLVVSGRAWAAWGCPSSTARRRRGVDRHDPPRARARRDVARHGRHVRPAHERAARRPGDRRPARPGRARDEVRHRARPDDPAARGVDGRPDVRAARLRRARSSGSASTTSTSTTSTASTRRRRSRRPSARWPSSCSRARCATSASPRPRPRRSAARTPSTRSPRCRPSTRSGRATPRTRSCRPLRELGIGFVAYSPLGRGFLTGAFRSLDDLAEDDFRRRQPALPGREPRRQPRHRRARSSEWRTAKGATPAQLALAWVLAQGDDIVPIPGTKRAPLSRGERRRARRRADRRTTCRPARGAGGAPRAIAMPTCRRSTAERRGQRPAHDGGSAAQVATAVMVARWLS